VSCVAVWKMGRVKGVCTQRSRQPKVRPINGISQVRLVPKLGDVGQPAVVGVALAIGLPIAPHRCAPGVGYQEWEVASQLRARAVDDSVIVEALASPALEDRNAPDPLAEPCRCLAEHRPIQLVQEMPHVLGGGGVGQPLGDVGRSIWNRHALAQRKGDGERGLPLVQPHPMDQLCIVFPLASPIHCNYSISDKFRIVIFYLSKGGIGVLRAWRC
jgi:hypothetical protein